MYQAAEAGILKLRNLPAIYQKDKDIYRGEMDFKNLTQGILNFYSLECINHHSMVF